VCTIPTDATFPSVYAFDWSPEGTLVALIRGSNPGASLVEVLRVSDCKRAVVASNATTPPPYRSMSVAWHSDHRLLYADVAAYKDSTIRAVDVHPTTLKTAPPVRTARLAGIPLVSMSVSRDGEKLLFLRFEAQTDVYLCELDKKGLPVSPPRRWTLDERRDAPEAWALDSKSLYFISERNGSYQIFRRRIDSGLVESIVSGPAGYAYTRVSPDGKWLLFASAPPGRRMESATHIVRIPISGGPPQEVLALNGILKTNGCAWAPHGPCIVGEIRGKEFVISTYDPENGRGPEVLRLQGEGPGSSLSPDGRHIAVLAGDPANRIRVYGLEGRLERDIAVKAAVQLRSPNWASDGRGFYCGNIISGGSRYETLRVELDGTSQVIWEQSGLWATPSPDGKLLALMGLTRESNAWLLRRN
jgi:Tol biopolymer transport system component